VERGAEELEKNAPPTQKKQDVVNKKEGDYSRVLRCGLTPRKIEWSPIKPL